jgi:RND family efflux transporter MFP subunit
MKVTGLIFLAIFFSTHAQSAEQLLFSPEQIKKLGIGTTLLPSKQMGELAGIPALVVIPSNQQFTISTPLAGMINQTLVGIGDSVKKGQLLATLHSPAFTEAQNALLQATTQYQLTQDNFTRDDQLFKEGIIAESRYRATQSQQRAAAANLAERRQLLKLAGMSDADIAHLQSTNNLSSELNITSPINGVVLEKSANAGQRLEMATAIFKVARLDTLSLEIQAPLASTHDIKVGAKVSIPTWHASGKLTAIGGSLSGGNQTILLRAVVQEGSANLRPGQFVEANIATNSTANGQWTILNNAISRLGERTVVFVENVKGFQVEPITVLHEGANSSVITGKFKGDEKIAIKGVSSLKANLMGIGGGE